jgi:hypothetical protein
VRGKKAKKDLYEIARNKREDSGVNKENKILGFFFGLYNQEHESRIVDAVFVI